MGQTLMFTCIKLLKCIPKMNIPLIFPYTCKDLCPSLTNCCLVDRNGQDGVHRKRP